MFQVTQIVRFLLERGLRFRNLGFCGHDLMWTVTFNAPVPIYLEGLTFFPPFLEGHHHDGAFGCDQDLALTVRIRDLNRRFQVGGLQVSRVCMLPTPLPRRQLLVMWMMQPLW